MMEKITENADGEGFWASIPSTPEGDTETASTLPNYDVNMPFNSDNVNIILESSTTDWKTKLTQSDDIDDISEVFRALFRADIPSSGSPYFKDTYSSQVMSIDKLIAREPADPQRVKRAHDHMQAAKSGDGEKRKPIYVLDMGNGQYKVLDGNTTLQALKELGETQAVVEIKKSLKQQVGDQKSLDAVYAQAEKALPEFKNWVEEYARKTGATRVMLRPGLKGRERAGQKVENDYAGCAARLTDIVGGTLLYDRVEDVVSAFKLIGKDPAVSKAKNRFENPTSDGYRDIMMVVNVGGHLCELQLNTHAILEAKEKGLGHKLYEITRQLKAIANNNKSEGGDLYFTARGYVDELTDISIKVYRNAAISSANSSASNMASDSEIGDEFNRILVQLSGSSISTHFSGFRESIRKMLPVNFSIAKATSSFSTKSNMSDFMADVTPFDDKNITRNGHKVNAKVIKGRYTRAYLNDGSLLKLQYAVVESDDLVTSHNTDFSLNPEFPQELQPRDRTRDTMRQQIASISGKLNPDLLGGSLYASVGSPIVGRDLVVESGNGRTMGIKTRYERDEAPQYKAWLIDTAQKIGVDPEQIKAMKRPVLVRIRISDQNRKTVTERANEGDIAAMSPVETAKVDSGRLQPDDMDLFHPGDDGEIATAANNAFITRFLKLMGPAESAGLLTADGKPTRQLLERIQAAVFDKAFHDERLLALMAEDANPDIRNILKALTMSAPAFARVKAMAGDEQIDAINHIVGAVDLIRRAKREGENVETILNQLGLFGEEIPEETALVTRFLVKNARSAKRIAEALQTVAAKYRYWAENQSQPDLFGNLPEKPSAMDVLRAALADNGGGSQPGLFESSLSNVPKPIMAIVDGLRLAVSIDKNQAPIDVPPNWIIFNAPRPLYGDKEWQGDFIHGRFYVAVDPNGDQAAWCVQQNKAMDAWVYQYVDKDTMRAMVRQSYIDGYFKGNVEKADKALKNFKDDFFMQGFRNILDKMVFGDFQRLEAKSIRKIDNQNRDMADLSKHREFLKQERIDGEKRAAEHHDRVAQNVPIPGWTTENGILVLRSGNSRYVAVPKTGKKNSARFDLIDLQSGQFLSILGKNEVADWLWRSAQTEFEDKHGYPPGAYIPDDIRNAKSMDEIVAVFERVFGGLGKSVI
ncbi:hypothetical protein [Desulfatirhabdium butyrativorans]|uniref:hypothetical protein n=1 Tax=Desulfatirhabdium butyrativorans TaxID=340467 RepID=UPI0012EC8133|nr:hypothetical protein [Desulfatirhabdium butyrativorans]